MLRITRHLLIVAYSTQMCIHFQSVYHNGIENYMQVMRLALDDTWQMHSIWAMSGIVWAISSGVLVWHWRVVSLDLVNDGGVANRGFRCRIAVHLWQRCLCL